MKKTIIAAFSLLLAVPTIPATGRSNSPFDISLSPKLGRVTESFWPRLTFPSQPNFIVIQNAHCNLFAQYAISGILRQLKWQGFLPERIAVEGAVGPVDIRQAQRKPDANQRRKLADDLALQGEINGVMHFAIAEGEGTLYGVESADLYRSAVEMFRRSYWARVQLSRELDKLDAALALLKADPALFSQASILTQDVQVLHRLVDQRLARKEIPGAMNRAVYAVDHLQDFLPNKKDSHLLEAVSAAVDFYALALLRDEALFKHALKLRQLDRQVTTVIVCGGLHTAGLAERLKGRGYSFIVIKPEVRASLQTDERSYVERIMGHPVPLDAGTEGDDTASIHLPDLGVTISSKKTEIWALATDLRQKLPGMQFTMPPVRDIFTAMDQSWLTPAVKRALIRARSEILLPAVTTARNSQDADIF